MSNNLSKKIVLCVTGSIAAYKTPCLTRELVRFGHTVKVVLTKSAASFVAPLALQVISGNTVHEDISTEAGIGMEHIDLARWADIVLVAPASANFIARLSAGLADDLPTALCLATGAPVLIAPAMNQQMWQNPATQENVTTLKNRRYFLMGPADGIQACGEEGPGRMLEPWEIAIKAALFEPAAFFSGIHMLVTAGPTHEPLDPVRYIANRSSGKMGYAIAEAAYAAGAHVTLVTGPTHLSASHGITVIRANTANEMQLAVRKEIHKNILFICAAAVADFSPVSVCKQKIKKSQNNLTIELKQTEDILKMIRFERKEAFLVGFAAETDDLDEYASIKKREKNLDMLVANDISQPDSGFESDFNAVKIFRQTDCIEIDRMPKYLLASQIIKIINESFSKKNSPVSAGTIESCTA